MKGLRGEEAVGLQPLADSLQQEGRGREAGRARERNAEGRGAVGTEQCAIVMGDVSTGLMTVSIVNYVVYHSNGGRSNGDGLGGGATISISDQ